MRTIKVLVCAAALAAGIAASMAQSNVYSLNVVGYYNVTVAGTTQVILANQLNTTNNDISAIIPNGPPDATVNVWTGTGFIGAIFDDVDLAWENGGNPAPVDMSPGTALFYYSPVTTTLTFVGEVLQSPTLTVTLSLTGLHKSLVASKVPQTGGITSVLGLPAEPDDTALLWDPVGKTYYGAIFDDVDLAWENNGQPAEPTPKVGEGFFYIKAGGSVSSLWVRNFTVQ